MPRIEHRPFTADERKTLEDLAGGRGELGHDLLNGGCLAMLVFLPAMLILRWIHLWSSLTSTTVLVLAVGFAVVVVRRMRKDLRRAAWLYEEDLKAGRMVVATYDVRSAVRVEEFEDEGSQYLLELIDGGVLFLGGQYLYEAEENGSFPSTRIQTERAEKSGTLFELHCTGTPVEVLETLPHFTVADHEAALVPDDGEILDVSFAEQCALLRNRSQGSK